MTDTPSAGYDERMDGWDDDEDFYEDDEPLEIVMKAFANGVKGVTAQPGCCYDNLECVSVPTPQPQTHPRQHCPETR
jgi:hypothetical protein